MNALKIVLVLLTASCGVALQAGGPPVGGPESTEPKALVQARADYQRQVKIAVDPIQQKYIAYLEVLKRQLGGQGDITGAKAVQDEIDSLKASDAAPATKVSAAGKWGGWQDKVLVLSANGTATLAGFTGTWTQDGNRVVISWGAGWSDEVTISGDGRTLSGKCNNDGTERKGKRLSSR